MPVDTKSKTYRDHRTKSYEEYTEKIMSLIDNLVALHTVFSRAPDEGMTSVNINPYQT